MLISFYGIHAYIILELYNPKSKALGMTNFTPIASFLGGVLIGLSASAMLLFNGKVAGISGILAGVLQPVKADTLWRTSFIGGLVVGGLILRVFVPEAFDFGTVRSMGALTVAGLLASVRA